MYDTETLTRDELEQISRKAADEFDLYVGLPNVELEDGELDDTNGDWRVDYSGRGMYGRDCVGVVLSGVAAFAHLTLAIADVLGAERAFEILGNVREDSMGYSTIYYFPGVGFDGDDE